MLDLNTLLQKYGIKPRGVIHIGAHEGNELNDYLNMGVKKLLFIEANPSTYSRLLQTIGNTVGVVSVQCAISDHNGMVTLHITSMDQSCSILPLGSHKIIYPNFLETAQLMVPSRTLDSLLSELGLNPEHYNVLNIGIQGAELLAFKGAADTLQYIDIINTEVNFEELYQGCCLIHELDDFLHVHGFERKETVTPYHPSWGDALYVKRPVISMSSLGANGRFANQLFQYAFMRCYAQSNSLFVETPAWVGQYLFGHNDPPVSQLMNPLIERSSTLGEAIVPYLIRTCRFTDFWGYFQYHTSYYLPYRDYFRSLFKPVPQIEVLMHAAFSKLSACGKTVVGIHLRRGDYGHAYFFVSPTIWYREWLAEIWPTLDSPVLFIASDELDEIVGDFADYHPVTIHDLGVAMPEAEFYPDFYILSQCDVVAISNSSFSFAACMLNCRGRIFFRPHLLQQCLISFDPWDSEVLLLCDTPPVESVPSLVQTQSLRNEDDICRAKVSSRKVDVERISVNDRFIEIQVCKAIAYKEEGNLDAAATLLNELVQVAPEEPIIQYYLGVLAMEQQDYLASCGYFRELVRLQPDYLEGRMLFGMILAEMGQHAEAVELLRGVLADCPGVAEIHHRLGLCLADLHRYEDAYREYQEVLRLVPDHVGVLCSLGLLFSMTGQVGEARQFLLRALEKEPGSVNVINNLARVSKIGHAAEGLQWFQKGLDIEPENPSLTSNYLYTLNYIPGLSPEFIAEKYREYAPRAFHPPSGWHSPTRTKGVNAGVVRIGYLSADLYGHSVAFFLESIMQHHDRKRFEIFCYSNRSTGDETTERLKSFSTGWRCIVGMSDPQVAELIAADGIDILVELSGHTAGHRLGVCALKPAPVQASWLGHPNSTGLPQMDYYVTDSWCDPPGMTEHLYSERLYRLPRVFCCYLPPVEFPPVTPVPALVEGMITFGSFNSITKVNEELISWWSRILAAVPGSRLFIKGPALDDATVRTELLECFCGHGILPERLLIQGVAGTRVEHLALYAKVDIALDTFPYHGTTTTCEALWMGVPVVTLAGNTHVSRVGVSLLHSVGLDDLIAENPSDYIARAVSLANQPQRLVELREELRLMMARSPLMDAEGVTREVEAAYMTMLSEKERNRV